MYLSVCGENIADCGVFTHQTSHPDRFYIAALLSFLSLQSSPICYFISTIFHRVFALLYFLFLLKPPLGRFGTDEIVLIS